MSGMLRPVLDNPWVRAAALVGGVVLAWLTLSWLDFVLVPLFFAFLVAYIFNPAVDAIAKVMPRIVAVLLVLGGLFLMALSFPLVIVPGVISEANGMVERVAQAPESEWFNSQLDDATFKKLVENLGWAPEGQPEYNARAVLAENITSRIKAFLTENAGDIAGAGKKASVIVADFFFSLGGSLIGFAVFIANLCVFTFVTLYLLNDYHSVLSGAEELIPPRHRPWVNDIMGKIDQQLRSFLHGQFLVCCCLGLMYGTGMYLSGVPFAIPIGLYAVVAGFVPFFGAASTMIPAVLLTLLEHGIDGHIIGVLITFSIAQFIESNFLTPKITGSKVGLHPVMVILAVLVFGKALGVLGLLLAVPSAAVLRVLVVEGIVYYRGSEFYKGKVAPKRKARAKSAE